ncbi:MAG TPA: hypothetical protein VL486_12670 [Verrucomicrobiae bacterium]|nr:hypothetical protein [Verrucomicrobiae bacterium]
MSDTIDAAAQPAVRAERVRSAASRERPAVQIPARDYVALALGFYLVFWGLLVTLLTGAQLLIFVGASTFTEWFLGAGVLATLIGSGRLYQARSAGERWHSRARVVFGLAILLVYFCFFFYLWRRVPTSAYLMGNALAFAATGILYLVAFNHAVAALATALGRPNMALESHLLSVSNIGLLLLPFVCAIAYVIGASILHKGEPLAELQSLLGHANLLVIVVLLLPFSLTLSLAWSCKDVVLRELATLDHPRELGSGPS